MEAGGGGLMASPLVHAIGWFGGQIGYNVHTDNLFGRLARLMPVVATPLKLLDGPIERDRALIARTWPGRPVISIALLHGWMMHVLDEAPPGPRIAYTVWESTKLPDSWRAPLARADQIWVPTAWNRDVFVANGLDGARIRVVPEGVNSDLFNPRVPPVPDLARRSGFKFINIGKWEERKGTARLIKAFDDEFAAGEDVWLVLSCYNPHFPDIDFGAELRALQLKRPGRLLLIPPIQDHARIAGLYTSCQAFVSPTRAEGWGLPIIEAMACGLPAIVTGYSGQTAFMGPHAYPIDYRLVPVDVPFFAAADGDFGLWAEPDIGHMRRLMREVYENPEAARKRGLAGGEWVRSRFSWDQAARIAAETIASTGTGLYTGPETRPGTL
jgi:glycosyltransferase involved in cell wall biosynthesis